MGVADTRASINRGTGDGGRYAQAATRWCLVGEYLLMILFANRSLR